MEVNLALSLTSAESAEADPFVMVTKSDFHNAMASLVAGVCVVTSGDSDGIAGCTVTATCSVSDSPPTMLVCISSQSETSKVASRSSALCINILSTEQQSVAHAFSLSANIEKFSSVKWVRGVTGSPMLEGTLASLECEVTMLQQANTHTIFFCKPITILSAGVNQPLCYFDRKYQRLL